MKFHHLGVCLNTHYEYTFIKADAYMYMHYV